jgi:hypothetical protein
MLTRLIFFLGVSTLLLTAQTKWTPANNETVVLLGDTFFERDYHHGHLETALTLATAGNNIRIRNLGWSGDTPRCESRSYFGLPAEGFERLRKQLEEIKPTTVIACYGAVDAYQGAAGLEAFLASYQALLQMIQSTCGAKIILMSPPAVSRDAQRFPSLSGHNVERGRYSRAVAEFAAKQSHGFADLFTLMKDKDWVTIHGVTFTDQDYASIAPLFLQSLGLTATTKPQPNLRGAIIAKNHLFFQRWRPQNEIYLFGSRKHEQGRNGAEIPQFDPLIAQKEQQIFQSLSAQ